MKKIGWAIVLLLCLVFQFSIPVHAEIRTVGDNDTEFTEGNRLLLFKNADIKGFSITTNIPSSRLTTYTKTVANGYFSTGGARYITEEGYKTQNYPSFQRDYGSKTLAIDNLKLGDRVDVNYKNVGTYNGQSIDVKLTISNVEYARRSSLPDNGISLLDFGENPFSGFYFANIEYGTLEYTFYYSSSGKTVSLDGNSFLSFNSLNGYNLSSGLVEFVNYLNYDTSKAGSAVDAYVRSDTNVEYQTKIANVGYTRPAYVGISNDFTDVIGGKTFTKNTVSFQIKGTTQKFIFGGGYRTGWTNVSTGVLFNVTAVEPTVTVRNASGQDINGRYIGAGQDLIYFVNQEVNTLGQDVLDKYSDWAVAAKLPANLTYSKAELVNASGNVVKDAGTFAYNSSTREVTFKASDNLLSNVMDYTGETYSLKIYTKVNTSVGNGVKLQNLATSSTINGVSKQSGTTVVTVDKTAPTVSVSANTTSTVHDSVTLTAKASDANIGMKRIKKPDGSWVNGDTATYNVTDNGTYTFVAEDVAGNQASKSYAVKNIDKTISFNSPSISSITAPITITDKAQATGTNVSAFTVSDWRSDGSNKWRVDVSATPLTMAGSSYKLPSGSLQLNALSGITRLEGSGTNPQKGFNGKKVIDNGKVSLVQGNGSRGVYQLSFPNKALEFVVDPTTAKPGNYSTTVTWELVQAP
ncbi:hypothetical protein GZ22_18290 (plasmid) [Terribacillus saccharophilus]|uniref:Adhesin isopeptide-forming adherence domain-containing protein n=1 Tax=Terribacillus saccharophilus TaxID=361277 RepID=A0A075LQW1_9BACI|nr:hypothetical protein [Terribacillus goriensis]AIF68387.1 hypothetical protein GZ22_18290 [Terribacillus goriensis]